jgi:hypothetical protein
MLLRYGASLMPEETERGDDAMDWLVTSYDEYLQTERWAEVRSSAIEEAGGRCEDCGSSTSSKSIMRSIASSEPNRPTNSQYSAQLATQSGIRNLGPREGAIWTSDPGGKRLLLSVDRRMKALARPAG